MITLDTLRDTLYDWMAANTSGLTRILWLDQNVPRPVLPYIGARISPLNKPTPDYIERPENLQDAQVLGNREFTLEIQHFGPGGFDRLEGLRSSLEMPQKREVLDAQGIAYVDDMGITNISELLDERFESRYSLELLFRVGTGYTATTGQIDTVKMDKKFKNAESVTVFTETDFTIPPP